MAEGGDLWVSGVGRRGRGGKGRGGGGAGKEVEGERAQDAKHIIIIALPQVLQGTPPTVDAADPIHNDEVCCI